jgi:hypothetical protein
MFKYAHVCICIHIYVHVYVCIPIFLCILTYICNVFAGMWCMPRAFGDGSRQRYTETAVGICAGMYMYTFYVICEDNFDIVCIYTHTCMHA